jgi:hypothetical protein
MDELTKAVTIKEIPVGLWKRVRLEAITTGKSVSEYVTQALTRAIGKNKEK